MSRYLILVVLLGLLAACTGQQAGETDQSLSAEPSTASASGGATGGPSPACEEAFAPLAEAEVASAADLGDLPEEVDATIQSCESVADWIAGAQQVVENEVRPGTADLLLRIRCEDTGLSRTAICEELS